MCDAARSLCHAARTAAAIARQLNVLPPRTEDQWQDLSEWHAQEVAMGKIAPATRAEPSSAVTSAAAPVAINAIEQSIDPFLLKGPDQVYSNAIEQSIDPFLLKGSKDEGSENNGILSREAVVILCSPPGRPKDLQRKKTLARMRRSSMPYTVSECSTRSGLQSTSTTSASTSNSESPSPATTCDDAVFRSLRSEVTPSSDNNGDSWAGGTPHGLYEASYQRPRSSSRSPRKSDASGVILRDVNPRGVERLPGGLEEYAIALQPLIVTRSRLARCLSRFPKDIMMGPAMKVTTPWATSAIKDYTSERDLLHKFFASVVCIARIPRERNGSCSRRCLCFGEGVAYGDEEYSLIHAGQKEQSLNTRLLLSARAYNVGAFGVTAYGQFSPKERMRRSASTPSCTRISRKIDLCSEGAEESQFAQTEVAQVQIDLSKVSSRVPFLAELAAMEEVLSMAMEEPQWSYDALLRRQVMLREVEKALGQDRPLQEYNGQVHFSQSIEP